MRLGIAANLHHSSPEDWAQLHRELGCTSVIFPVDYTADEELIEAYVKAAKKYDLLIAEVGAWCSPIAEDVKERESAKRRCIEQLKLADRVGAKCCVNVSGSLGPKWSGPFKRDLSKETWDMVVESIREIIDAANPQNTYYVMEAMPWMIPMTPDEYVELIKAVDREKFGVHMDIVNWITCPDKYFNNKEFIVECFAKLGDKVKSCHLKDIQISDELTFQLKEVKCGDGTFNLEEYARCVNDIDRDIPMLIEHLKGEEAYRQSFAYVRERLNAYVV